MMTVSKMEYASYWFWSCFKTDRRAPGLKEMLPEVGSSSPERIFRNVDLPAPFAPMTP